MKIQRVFTAVFLAFALLLANVAVARAMPPLPSSFYGTVKLDGANVPTGTVVSARINGVIYAWGTALIYEGDTVYTFDVPGEDTDEPGIQGGVPGDTVVFYIGDYIADQTAPWQGGTLEELNLTASTNRTVVFDANGGTGTMSPQVANAPTALTLNAFARSGYTFSGWNTAANGSGTSYADGATYPFAADATLYAQWTANSYTVTFDANGGTAPSPATKPVTFDAAYGALATTSRTGYAFAGWFTAETGGTEVTAATIVSNTADHTLYAQWTANSYT
ncbi:MAG: InlB B-repeat-containing protein, partial [Anaerolineales bacterium]|nr:InlB B-repeat-containing protein [Anaerolineales bacterium]